MTTAYDKQLRSLTHEAAEELGMRLQVLSTLELSKRSYCITASLHFLHISKPKKYKCNYFGDIVAW